MNAKTGSQRKTARTGQATWSSLNWVISKMNNLSKPYVFFALIALMPTHVVNAATYFFHNDHLGTPQALTDSNQQVVWQSEQDPFGEVTEVTNQVEQNLRFPGQYFDTETGLQYNYFRNYDPIVGRYVTSDPIGLAGGINTYGYVGGNPIGGIDPLGLDCVAVNGSVTCSNANMPTVTFPRPAGWPATINSNSDNHHLYNIQVPLNGANAACVMQGVANNPTPGNPSPATLNGTLNNATPSTPQDLFNFIDYVSSFGNDSGGYNNSPVTSYLRDNGNAVVNVTKPGHPLHPGYVVRTVNGSNVNNVGEGIGFLQGQYSPLAGAINGVWNNQSQGIVNSCGCF